MLFSGTKVLKSCEIRNFLAKNMLFLEKYLHNSKKGSTFAVDFRHFG